MYMLKHVVHNHRLLIRAPTRSLKSSKVGTDMTLAGRPFQKRAVGGKIGCIVLLFYVHGKHLRSCRGGQLV